MKLAVLSDIHSNIVALNLAIDDLKNENVDKICFLGDYISDGENDNEILNIIKNVSDYTIFGNREKYIFDYSPLRKDYNNYKTIHATYSNLSEENLKYIKTLEEYCIIEVGKFKILMIHGHQHYAGRKGMEEMFDRMIAKYDFDVCIFGHTHKYLYREYKNKIFINPGSIGQPCDGTTYKYCIVELTDKVKVTLKEFDVKESFAELISNYKRTEYFKNNRVWSTLILYSIRDGLSYNDLFIEQFNDKIKDLGELNAEDFNKIWDDAYSEFKKEHGLEEI